MGQIVLNIPVKFEQNCEIINPVDVCPLELWRKEVADSVDKYVNNELERLYESRNRVTVVDDEAGVIMYANENERLYTYDITTQKTAEELCEILRGDAPIDMSVFTCSQIDLMLRAAVHNAAFYHGLVSFPKGSYAQYTFTDVIDFLIDCK